MDRSPHTLLLLTPPPGPPQCSSCDIDCSALDPVRVCRGGGVRMCRSEGGTV